MQQSAVLKLTRIPCYAERKLTPLPRRASLCVCTAFPVRGRSVPAAAAECLERMKYVAGPTPALRHAAAQHRVAPHVRRAQAMVQVVSFDERLGAARHAAHERAVARAPTVHFSVIPLLQHGQRVAAVRRHATCVPACK